MRRFIKTSLSASTVAIVACGLLTSIAIAQPLEEVTVQAKRLITTKIVSSRSSIGVPILDVSVSYGVSTAGLDLKSHEGMEEMEKRVNDAAVAACDEIQREYPNATPDQASCAKQAAAKAMTQVHRLAHADSTKPVG